MYGSPHPTAAKVNRSSMANIPQDVSNLLAEGIHAVQVDYTDKAALVKHLAGVHTVLSFITVHVDPENVAQKTLIDASVEAGVKRFAPSEWSGYV